MSILTEYKGRPTKDMDFLACQINNDMERIKKIFSDICTVDCADDGLIFNSSNIDVERIKEDADYEGVRVKIIGSLGNAKKSLQIDIGFGDIIVPKPKSMTCPTLLDIGAPIINVYSTESIIAEKFQAMIFLSVGNSRMKDFYDIYTLLNTNQFKGESLKLAIYTTLKHRKTILHSDNAIFEQSFSEDFQRNVMWKAFLRKNNVSEFSFSEVMKDITVFLKPIHDSILNEKPFIKKWDCEKRIWIN